MLWGEGFRNRIKVAYPLDEHDLKLAVAVRVLQRFFLMFRNVELQAREQEVEGVNVEVGGFAAAAADADTLETRFVGKRFEIFEEGCELLMKSDGVDRLGGQLGRRRGLRLLFSE